MRIHDFVDEGLGHSSDVIDLGDGTAAIVDPPRFPIGHETLAGRLGLRVAWTLDTHSHADYVTGSPCLARRSGAVFLAPAASHLASPHQAVHDGEHVTSPRASTCLRWPHRATRPTTTPISWPTAAHRLGCSRAGR